MWGIVIFCIFLFISWDALRAIFKPIFAYIYELVIGVFTGMGMRESAAKALISVIIIAIIVLVFIF